MTKRLNSTMGGWTLISAMPSAIATMVMKGNGDEKTAMSKLVGLPIGIFVKLVMLGKINSIGVNIPVMKEVYEPVLEELMEYGVVFQEKEELIRS